MIAGNSVWRGAVLIGFALPQLANVEGRGKGTHGPGGGVRRYVVRGARGCMAPGNGMQRRRKRLL